MVDSGSTRPADGDEDPFATPTQRKLSYAQRRRAKMIAEIERNRRGDYSVPTWVLVACLAGIIVIFAGMLIFG